MKRFMIAGLLLCLTAAALAQTGTPQTKTQLNTETTTNFPDNTSGLITPLLTRQSMMDYIASWQQTARVNAQTGTTYNVVADDYGKLVTFTNGSPVAVGLPQATGTFSVFNSYLCNTGGGTVTITPTTSTINGVASMALGTGQCVQVVSDGTNYQVFPGPPPATTSFNSPAFSNCSLAASVGSNLLTVALKDAAGNDPSAGSKCQINFRSSTLTTGALISDTVSAALSINTNAVGATLGSANSTAFRFWVVAFDNGGTVVLALYNATTTTGCRAINEDALQSSTAMSGTATSAQTFYTPNGTTLTSKAVRILGYVEYNSTGLATAGTYASAPNFVMVQGPGSKRPCDTVSSQVANFPTANSTTTSGTFVTTATTITLSSASAANIFLVEASGRCLKATSGQTNIQLSRGNTNNTNMIGSFGTCSAAGGTSNSTPMAMDYANTLGSLIYTVQINTSDANTATWGNSQPAIIRVTEFMG